MKYFFYLIILAFPLLCFSQNDSIINMNYRIGDSISLEERNYFGLFPKIPDFQYAKLIKGKNLSQSYFLINTTKSTVKLQVSDSLISEFNNFIYKYEEYINFNRSKEISINPILKKDLFKPRIYYRTRIAKPQIKLMDGEVLDWYLVYHNDSCLVVSTTNYVNNFRNIKNNFRIINYNEIDTIKNVEYPVIKGKKPIFNLNFASLDSLSMYFNVDSVIAPELRNLLESKRIYPLIWDKEEYDFDEIYGEKHFVSFYFSRDNFFYNAFQAFIPVFFTRGFAQNAVILLDNFYSYGVEYGYSFKNNLSLKTGILLNSYTLTKVQIGTYSSNPDYFNSYTFKLDLLYNFWHSEKFKFEDFQLFTDVFAGFNLTKIEYTFDLQNRYKKDFKNINYFYEHDISQNLKLNFHFGLLSSLKISDLFIVQLKGHINYNNFSGYLLTNYNYITQRIDGIFSYGFDIGLGVNF